jgi:uncharacterized protein YdaL
MIDESLQGIKSSVMCIHAASKRRYAKVITLVVMLLTLSALVGSSPTAAQPQDSVLVLYDSGGPYAHVGEAHALLLANLLGHFADQLSSIVTKPVTAYTAGEMDNQVATFYVGSTYEERSYFSGTAVDNYDAFLADAATTSQPVIWLNYNLWQLTYHWNPAWGAASFAEKFGFDFTGIQNGLYNRVMYKQTELLKGVVPFANPGAVLAGCVEEGSNRYACATELNTVTITDAAKAQRYADTYSTLPDGGATTPYVVHAGPFWFVGDLPFLYFSEEDRYLAFADLLHDMLGIEHAESHRALVRLEDVSPGTTSVDDLNRVAKYLRRQHVPFSVATVPLFKDPLGITNDSGTPTTLRLPNSDIGNTLSSLASEGLASIVLHGYTHQWDGGLNPYNMLTGDDFEFYRVTVNDDFSLNVLGPVPEDSAQWAQQRIASANELLSATHLQAFAWEAPHYLASATDYRAIQTQYGVHYGRLIYFGLQNESHDKRVGQFFPYVIHRDHYGYQVIPEDLGNIEPEPFDGYRTLFPADLIRHAEKLKVVRDGVASFFYHPYLVPPYSPFYLRDVVKGLKNLGYQFVSAPSLLTP